MSNPKSLTDDQVSQIRAWAAAGDGLPEIQKKLREELGLSVTYLETRFLLEDLSIELLPSPEPEAPKKPEADEEALEGADGEDRPGAAGGVKVTVDQVLRPGAILSGKVDFDGQHTASWWLDQMGRLGLDGGDVEFQPSEEQLIAFQQELRKVVQQSGF